MPVASRPTSQIDIMSWTTIQHKLLGAGQFGDTAPSDDLGGPGPYLVMENGVWIYPQQASVGRMDMPTKLSRPVRLMLIMADFGASATWTLTVASSANTTGTPYDSGDEPLYNLGSIDIATGTGQYLNQSYNVGALDKAVIIFPSQRLILTTVGAVAGATVRFTFSRAFDTKV